MADREQWEPAHIHPHGTEWNDQAGSPEPGEGDTAPKAEARFRPGVPEPGTKPAPKAPVPAPKPRILGAVLVTLLGAALSLTWWGFWWEADNASGEALTQFAWSFLYLGAVTCVYLYFVWRWIIRK